MLPSRKGKRKEIEKKYNFDQSQNEEENRFKEKIIISRFEKDFNTLPPLQPSLTTLRRTSLPIQSFSSNSTSVKSYPYTDFDYHTNHSEQFIQRNQNFSAQYVNSISKSNSIHSVKYERHSSFPSALNNTSFIDNYSIDRSDNEAGPSNHPIQYQQLSSPNTKSPSEVNEIQLSNTIEAPAPTFDPFLLMDPLKEPRTYNLFIRQSPQHGQMCTFGSKERRILDPLPIIQLDIRDRNGNKDLLGQNSPLLVMQVELIVDQIDFGGGGAGGAEIVENTKDERIQNRTDSINPIKTDSSNALHLDFSLREEENKKQQPSPSFSVLPTLRLLEGKLSASPHIVRDIEGSTELKNESSSSSSSEDDKDYNNSSTKSCFFIFTDLSIRLRGKYRLKFSLIKLGLSSASSSSTATKNLFGKILSTITSKPFSIYHQKHFNGMLESSLLAKSLANQGVHIPIRNENKSRKKRKQLKLQEKEKEFQDTSTTTTGTPRSSLSATPIARSKG